ncbi:1,3-beta-glucanosyltransferase gas1 [Homalodisca vitripennis]|nr:1,3-beta-glucanosyltransferase gas1 [Homalodisca vitripennis]
MDWLSRFESLLLAEEVGTDQNGDRPLLAVPHPRPRAQVHACESYISIAGPCRTRPPCHTRFIAQIQIEPSRKDITCECTDEMCRETKERVEVCRPQVTRATHNESIVSCRVAEWICSADGVCSTALDYYHHYCRSMFQGRKCSNRCKNSISILRRQEKAAKLTTCVCDGREGYDCVQIRTNMARLCYHREPEPFGTVPPMVDTPSNPREPSGASLPRAVLLLVLSCLLAT